MKLIVDTKSFIDAVSWSTKAFDSKEDKAYVALHVEDNGTGYLSHTNVSSHMKCALNIISVEFEEGEGDKAKLALDGAYIKRLASSLGDHLLPLQIEKDLSNPKTSLKISRAYENFTVPLLDTKVGETPRYLELGEVSEVEFFDTLQRIAKLADTVNAGSAPVIGTVDIKLNKDDNTIKFMATDRYALGEIVIDFNALDVDEIFFEKNKNLLLPAERASLISPSKGQTEEIKLIHDAKSNKFGYVFPDGRVALFSLSTADPLAYESLKQDALKTDSSVLLSTQELKKAISIVSNLAYDESSIVFNITSEGLTVSDSKGTNTLKVSVGNVDNLEDNDEVNVKFLRSVINEIFNPIATSRFNFKWKSESKNTFILEPVADDDSIVDNVFALASSYQG